MATTYRDDKIKQIEATAFLLHKYAERMERDDLTELEFSLVWTGASRIVTWVNMSNGMWSPKRMMQESEFADKAEPDQSKTPTLCLPSSYSSPDPDKNTSASGIAMLVADYADYLLTVCGWWIRVGASCTYVNVAVNNGACNLGNLIDDFHNKRVRECVTDKNSELIVMHGEAARYGGKEMMPYTDALKAITLVRPLAPKRIEYASKRMFTEFPRQSDYMPRTHSAMETGLELDM